MVESLSSVLKGWVAQVAREEGSKVNVRHFGAVPGQDSTDAFHLAAEAAGPNGLIELDPTTVGFILSETIQGQTNQIWRGAGCNSTTIKRSGNYGDTFNFANALACSVKGIFFRHGTQYANAAPGPLDNLATGGSAHIRLSGAQGAIIEDCWMWRMPYGVVIENGALVKIHRCNMQGTWDHCYANRQEGIASVLIGNGGYTQIISIDQCYFGGSLSEARDVVFTSSDTGAHTVNIRENVGGKNGVRVIRCEDLCISNSYFGNHNASNFATALAAGSVNLDWRFTGNFFDAGRNGACMNILTDSDGAFINGVAITGNVFNGEMQTKHAIAVENRLGDNMLMTNFTISGNTFQAFYATPIVLCHARGGCISGNSITGYNALGVSGGADYVYSTGIYFAGESSHILCNGNLFGGSINNTAPSPYCYHSVVKGSALPATIIDSNNFLIS